MQPPIRSRLLLSLVTVLISLLSQTVSSSISRRELDPDATTDPSQFYRRAWCGSVVLGDTLYVDGGEFTYDTADGPISYPYNSTYSLDLSTSWSPSSAQFNKIDKGDSPVVNTPNLWPASDGKSFFLFNGDITLAGQHRSDPPATPELWEFRPDGITDGTWRRVGYATSLIGTTRAKSTFGKGSVHILGGFNFDRTAVTDHIGTSNGMISYDMRTGQWQNRSMEAFAPSGWWLDGHLHLVDNLGGNGTLVAFGGVTDHAGVTPTGQIFVSFLNIGVFNPATGEWRNQTSNGDVPPDSRLACSVGVPGDDGTFEIFVHGGSSYSNVNDTQTAPQEAYDRDQVWVLSLPSFTWYKSSYEPATPRWTHNCHVPGNPPRRQMVAVGGVTPDQDRSLESRDPWPQGLGIFDLTKMEWLDAYDASADPYVTPTIVKNGISQNGSYPDAWNDPEVPMWLTGKSATELVSAGSPDSGSTSHGSSESSGDNGLSLGAIIAIVVCAVIAPVAFLLLLGWKLKWPIPFIKRKRRRSQPEMDRWQKAELESGTSKNPKHQVQEVDGITRVRYEMAGSTPAPVELPGDGGIQSDLTSEHPSEKSRS